MKHMDDNTLAAYLEGTLPEEDREWVEQAIEDDDELKAVVDEWIAMADDFCDNTMAQGGPALEMEACRSIGKVMEQLKQESANYGRAATEYAAMPACASAPAPGRSLKRKWPTYRKILIAASVVAFVGVTGIWLLQGPTERSAPSFGIPMGVDNPAGGYYKSAPTYEDEDTTITERTHTFEDVSELYE